ncbi:MAG: carbohydrate-binding protein [Chitinophagaceae bacterium]
MRRISFLIISAIILFIGRLQAQTPPVSNIPGTVEAEDFASVAGGIFSSSTNDVGGGLRLQGIAPASGSTVVGWMEYNVKINQTGSYTLTFRVGTPQSGAQFRVKLGGTTLATVNMVNTGDWGVWGDAVHDQTISLTASTNTQTLRIESTGGGTCDLNWIKFILTGNQPPTVSAGTNQEIISPASSVTLTGTASDQGGSISGVQWTQYSGPTESVTIVSPTSLTTNVTGLTTGVRGFRLTATDNQGATAFSDVTVTVNASTAPTADAGSPQTITGTQVTLTGSGQANNGGSISSYAWSKIEGNSVTITSPNESTTTVTGLSVGTYKFRLTVKQNDNQEKTSDVIITVTTAGTLAVSAGGTGQGTFTAGYLKSPGGTSAFTTSATIPTTDITGVLTVAKGGTNATTKEDALASLLPAFVSGKYLKVDGSTVIWADAPTSGGGSSTYIFNSPLSHSEGNVTITQATSGTPGYLSSTDWNTFNNKLSSQWITGANNTIYYNTANVGIGVTNPAYKLTVGGTIGARKVKVTSETWADYVFEKNYKLPTLAEVEKYIEEHKHLPEIPSAKEVEKNGVDVGDNQVLLLKKIEELTLYLIEQNKKIEKLQQEINTIKNK